MSQRFFHFAGALGLAVIAWVGWGFIGHSALALAVTAVIGVTFVVGALELRRFRAQTTALDTALDGLGTPPERLDDWLATLPAPLQQPVRQRIEQGRGTLPGPALTPYLVGLLVMLGMLGTFLGMVVTFQGTVFALETSGDVGAMRAALAAPIRGLGLSFGTSVAGVAASALLGLMSALSRRERLEALRRLEGAIAQGLRGFSLAAQRDGDRQASERASLEALAALQAHTAALPAVAEKLASVMERLEQRSEQLDARLLERQAQFQQEVAKAHDALNQRLGQALETQLGAGLDRAVSAFHDHFAQQSTGLLAQVQAGLGQAEARQADAERQRASALGEALQAASAAVNAMREEMARAGEQARQAIDQAGERARDEVARAALPALEALAQAGRHLEEERSRASEREQAALRERAELLQGLADLIASTEQAAEAQRQAVEQLAAASTEVLTQAGTRFHDQIGDAGARVQATLSEAGERFTELLQAQSELAAQHGAQAAASAEGLATTSESFGQSVQAFDASTGQLLKGLQRIEAALAGAHARHDEQLAYYVAQAREVIDLSIGAQQGLVEALRQIQSRGAKGKAALASEEQAA